MPTVTINHNTCISCGLCYDDNCPDAFEEGGDSSSQLKAGFRKDTGASDHSLLYRGDTGEPP